MKSVFVFQSQIVSHPHITFSSDNKQWQFGAEITARTNTNHTVVIAAQSLCFELLEQILTGLSKHSHLFVISPNRFNQAFASTVINVSFDKRADANEPSIENALLNEIAETYQVDIAIKPSAVLDKQGLAVFDMDSTIIEMECIDEIAKLAGVGEEVSAVTERAMQGEIAFSDSLIHRVACLEGVELNKLVDIQHRLPYSPGFSVLVNELKRSNWTVAIASGGFTYFADHIKARFDLDVALSNQLDIKDGMLTGKVNGDIIDAQRKASLLNELAEQHGLDKQQTLAIGDGANDLVMMANAGYGVAYHAKPTVQAQASGSIRYAGLEAVLYLLG